ncbi:MAG TPA: hypothetical protein DDZ80_10585 [Cyanobacteria bacterium UBA8803]|nr:hypothetical protein [Cyanobacteria bacterium UBA9273]HBL58937.1 hypothetical protein [Cyanobacteria bacterium UBA8803]
MTATPTRVETPKISLNIQWERLPDNFELPDDPVESTNHPLLASALRELLSLGGLITPQMLIGGNLGICVKVNDKIVLKAPDWFYVPNLNADVQGVDLKSYTPNTDGDIPAIVMEFLSDADGGEYSAKSTYPYGKWYFYERILQVPVYVIFDPRDGTLEVHELIGGRYELQPLNDNGHYWFVSLGLYLGVWSGTKDNRTGYWLRWWDETGEMLPWGAERVEQSFQQGIQQGIQQGEIQGKLSTVERIVNCKIGAITPDIKEKLNNLSATALDELSTAIFDIANAEDLITWLTHH